MALQLGTLVVAVYVARFSRQFAIRSRLHQHTKLYWGGIRTAIGHELLGGMLVVLISAATPKIKALAVWWEHFASENNKGICMSTQILVGFWEGFQGGGQFLCSGVNVLLRGREEDSADVVLESPARPMERESGRVRVWGNRGVGGFWVVVVGEVDTTRRVAA